MRNKATVNTLKSRVAAASARGLTLIETALALSVMALVVASLSLMMAENADQVRARAAADKITEVHEAAKGYIKSNYAALLAQAAGGPVTIPAGRASAASAVPSGPGGLPSLQGGGFLSPGYVDANGYGQRHSLLVRRVAANPMALEAIVTTHGGRSIPDRQLGKIANMVGAMGGYVPDVVVTPADANQIVGSFGGWRSPRAGWGPTSPNVGSVQTSLAFEDGNLLTDYLYRDDIGIPQANRMNTAIDMNGNDINNINNAYAINVWADQNVRAGTDVIADNDVIARRDVRAERDLNVTRDGRFGRNVTVEGGTDVWESSTFRKNLTVRDNLTVEDNARIQGYLEGTTRPNSRGFNELLVRGKFKPDYLNIDTVVYNESPGANNRGLSETAGVRLGDLLPRSVPQHSYRVTPSANIVPKPSCGGDYAKARIMIYRQMDSVLSPTTVVLNSDNTFSASTVIIHGVQAADIGVTWRVDWVGQPAADSARQVIAQTFCFYG